MCSAVNECHGWEDCHYRTLGIHEVLVLRQDFVVKTSADDNKFGLGLVENDVASLCNSAQTRAERVARATRFRCLANEIAARIKFVAVFPVWLTPQVSMS
jgi:hypothetical protein